MLHQIYGGDMASKQTKVFAALILMAVAAISGCGGGGNALAPQFQPQVANLPDNFQFQTSGITNITQTLQYTWSDSGLLASINHSSTVTAGTATLTIKDAAGTQVYSGALVSTGTVVSSSGVTGNWTMIVTLTNVSGTLNFRVQKA
jgi:hypothetical protein